MSADAKVRPWRIRKKLLLALVLFVLTATVAIYIYIRANPSVFNESAIEHAHCISQAGMMLQIYAGSNDGHFPYHPEGYPQALLLLDGPWYPLTGPGYDGDILAAAKLNGTVLTEADCGRVYIQGLKVKSNGELVIMFDKMPTPGGDHCHLPHRVWAQYGREVLMVDGHHRFIPETEWPGFAREQVELLVAEGFPRAEAERLYELTTK